MDIAKCLPLTGGTLTGDLTCNQYLNINAWPGYGTGQAKLWYDATTANNKALRMDNVNNLTLSKGNVYHPGNKPTACGHWCYEFKRANISRKHDSSWARWERLDLSY